MKFNAKLCDVQITPTFLLNYTFPKVIAQQIKKKQELTKVIENNNHVLIGILAPGNSQCPFCDTFLIEIDIVKRRCMSCHQYLIFYGETLSDIVNIRKQAMIYTHDIDAATNGQYTKPIGFKLYENTAIGLTERKPAEEIWYDTAWNLNG